MDAFLRAAEIEAKIDAESVDGQQAEEFRIRYLGTKGILKELFGCMAEIEPARKKEFGQLMNRLKQKAEDKLQAAREQLELEQAVADQPDLTAQPYTYRKGSLHPLRITRNRVLDIFSRIGFTIAEEREIEDDWHNFTAMNTPEDHPARDMQDTFYLKDSTVRLLRTHTSSVQARIMTTQKPPIRIIAPGRVYRNETISSRSHCQFHQVEGLYIDTNVSFADMKQTLLYFAREMYGPETEIRLRPSFFPFTEPSAEMDVYWGLKNEDDYRITKGTGWLEILGCGMVDPNVLENCGIDPEKYSGFAFGMGIERQAMLQYKITDIRQLFENDTRFLKQFSSVL